MGTGVGALVGAWLGVGVGRELGESVGDGLGDDEGSSKVGEGVGTLEGWALGNSVGAVEFEMRCIERKSARARVQSTHKYSLIYTAGREGCMSEGVRE